MTGPAPLARRLLEVADAMAANLDTTSLLEQISRSALELFGGVGACWCRLDGEELTIVTAAGLSGELLGMTFPLRGSAVGTLLDTGERSLCALATRFPHLNDRIYGGPRDQVAVALAQPGGETTGALYVALRPDHEFGADELVVLELLASHAGMALHHVALYAQAERARREQAAVIAAMADGVAVVDADGTVRAANDALARMTGAEHVVGTPLPFPVPEPGEVLTSLLPTGRWVDVVVGPAGPGRQRVVSVRDVTAGKELEAAQEVFLASTSHELRTPLTVLRGYGDTLLRHWDVLEDDRRRELVERMLSRTGQMTGLVEQILLASAAGLSAAATAPQVFDLAEVVNAAAEVLCGSSETHPLTVRAPFPVAAYGRPESVPALLDQLVENAVKYSPGGGAIEVSVRSEPGAAGMTVADRGRGISPDELQRVFDRFYRGSGEPQGSAGVGLGLWIVRRTVEAQGGQITAEPREGGGTVVYVRLPAAPPPDAA